MNHFTSLPPALTRELSRRGFLSRAGLFAVTLSTASAQSPQPYPDPDFHQLDSWIVIHQNNTATFYVGKTDLGQGTGTAFRQMMADELDLAYDQTTLIMGSTDVTVDQGGSGGSDAIQVDAWPMRRVAAEARRVLLSLASQRLAVSVEQLSVRHGVITAPGRPARRLTYGEIIGGKKFNVSLRGANVDSTTGLAPLKPVQDLKIVGQSLPRYDIPAKVDGSLRWAVDVKLPGMVHARNIKPPFAGAQLRTVDESTVNQLPGFVKLVRKGNYLAVVCEREEQAILAARRLKATWEKPAEAPFPASEDLFTYMRAAQPTSERRAPQVGDPDSAFARAARLVEADYEIPFQGHTSFAPAHALADPSNGQLTIYTNDMKSYGMRLGVSRFLGIPKEQVRVVWMDGPQAYGRTAADDAGFEAAYLAREIGRPVRVQWMRDEEQAWDTKGPAFTCRLRGALDSSGQLLALDYDSRCCNYGHVGYNEHDTVLIAQLMGIHKNPPNPGGGAYPDDKYAIPHRRMSSKVVRLPRIYETPLRTGNLRDPNGPQVTFASESFIDELALAAQADPVDFRLRLLSAATADDPQFKRARSIAVVKAAAEAYGWQPRATPRPRSNAEVLTGRGFAYSFRSQTIVAHAVDVEVNRKTGKVWVRRIVAAQDCGLVINPSGVKGAIIGGTLHALSRTLHEEIRFDTEKPLGRDWISQPTLTHLDSPEKIDVVLVNGDPNPNRPDLPHYGAGETVCKPLAAAVANAIFDATGIRLRRLPLNATRVLAALRDAGLSA